MTDIAVTQISILFFQCLIVGSLLLFLFRLRNIFGLSLLFTALGVFQYMQVFLVSTLYVEVIPGVLLSPGSMVMFSGSLFAILLIYIREDALQTRKVVYALLVANIVLALLQYIFGWAIEGEYLKNLYNIPVDFFNINARILIVGSILLILDALFIIYLYELISKLTNSIFLRILVVMAVVLGVDSILFAVGGFAGTTQLKKVLISGLIGKLSAAIIYAALFTIYLKYIDKGIKIIKSSDIPFKDIFYLLSFRKKFEVVNIEKDLITRELLDKEMQFQQLFHTMAIGVVYQNKNGEITDTNPAALRILGLTMDQMQGKTSFDPDWKSIREDGTDFPGEEHPSIAALKTGKEVKNVVMGVFNTLDKAFRWIRINAIPQFKEGEDEPYTVFTTFDDITSTKKIELALKQNEYRYIQAQKLGKVGNWEYNIKAKNFWASDEANYIFGFDPDDDNLTVEDVESCIPERERVHQALVDLIEKGKEYNLEYEVLPKNSKKPSIVKSIAELQLDENGHPIKVIGVILEITQQKEIEDAIRKSESILIASQKMAKVGGWQWDIVKQKIFWTDETYQIHEFEKTRFEMDSEALINESLKCYDDEDRIKIASAFNNCIENGERYEFIVPFTTAKGRKLWVKTSGEAIREDGEIKKVIGVLQDITEQEEIKRNIEESQIRYKTLFESQPTIIWEEDFSEVKEGFDNLKSNGVKNFREYLDNNPDALIRFAQKVKIVEVNETSLEILEAKSKEEIITNLPYYFDSDLAWNVFKEELLVLAEGGLTFESEIPVRTIKNNRKDLYLKLVVHPDCKDNLKRVLVSFQDISQIKKAEKELRNSEAKLRQLLNNLESGVVLHAADTSIIFNNKRAAEILRSRYDTLTGKQVFDYPWNFLHEDGSILSIEDYPVSQIIKTKEGIENMVIGMSHEENTIWALLNGFPLLDEKGEIHEIIISFIEITEQVLANTKIKESEQKFRNIFENSVVGKSMTLMDGTLIVNKAFSKILGYTQEELNKISWQNITHPDDIKFSRQKINDIVSGKTDLARWEKRYIRKNGEVIWVDIGTTLQKDANGNPAYYITAIYNITERKKAEQELKRQSEFINTMTENQPAGIVACDAEGKLALFNKAAKEWHGVNIMKLPQEEWANNYGLYTSDGKQLLKTEDIPLVKAFNGEKVENYEFIIKAKGQEPRLVSCNGASFTDTKGSNFGAVVVMSDITRERTIENNLKKSESELKLALLEAERSEFLLNEAGRMAKIGGWQLDLKTMKPYFSKQTYNIYDLPETEPPKLEEGINFYAPEARPMVQKAVTDAIEKQKPYDLEVPFISAKGIKKWIRTLGLVQFKNNKPVQMYGAIQDITLQKEASFKLEESEEKYRLLAENTNDVISLHDTDSKYLYISPSIKHVRGYEPKELIGKSPYDFIHPDDIPLITTEEQIKELEAGRSLLVQYRFKFKDGKYGWFESNRQPVFNDKKEIIKVVSISRDITDRVERDKEILNYQTSLRNLTTEISLVEEKQRKEIAENIHDHLSQSLVISKMKLNELEKENELKNYLNDIQFLKTHISDALENSRKITYDLSPPVLYQLGIIDTVYWLADKIEDQYNIKVNFSTNIDDLDLSETALIFVYRIIQELITNTVKHANASEIELKFKAITDGLSIVFKDNGKGFDSNKLNNNYNQSGGFGLFAVKERIKNLNGTIKISSTINKGTEIIIFVPLNS